MNRLKKGVIDDNNTIRIMLNEHDYIPKYIQEKMLKDYSNEDIINAITIYNNYNKYRVFSFKGVNIKTLNLLVMLFQCGQRYIIAKIQYSRNYGISTTDKTQNPHHPKYNKKEYEIISNSILNARVDTYYKIILDKLVNTKNTNISTIVNIIVLINTYIKLNNLNKYATKNAPNLYLLINKININNTQQHINNKEIKKHVFIASIMTNMITGLIESKYVEKWYNCIKELKANPNVINKDIFIAHLLGEPHAFNNLHIYAFLSLIYITYIIDDDCSHIHKLLQYIYNKCLGEYIRIIDSIEETKIINGIAKNYNLIFQLNMTDDPYIERFKSIVNNYLYIEKDTVNIINNWTPLSSHFEMEI